VSHRVLTVGTMMSYPENNESSEECRDEQDKVSPNNFLMQIDYDALVRSTTGLLIIVIAIWLLAGIVKLMIALYDGLIGVWAHPAEEMVASTVIMLALLEIIRTLQSYLELGRVRLTFILDTALVVLVGELIGLWFKDYTTIKVLLSLTVISVLVVLRIFTAKYSKLLL
jgi:uncharacterized membrane protein (DUF373 family)